MNWYQEGIAEAVTVSKTKGAIFVVYIEGHDDKSEQITKLLNTENIATKLQGDNFVAIKIEENSMSHQQFSQIYKDNPVPSLYFIGKQGTPLEIITEATDTNLFSEKLDEICVKGGLDIKSIDASQNLIASEQQSSQVSQSNVNCDNGVCTVNKNPDEIDEIKDALSAQEKVERAKKLVEQKREEKQKEEAENERLKELERRKVGQDIQQMKKLQEDKELKQLLEEREKEKRERLAARGRILAQIAQDREERALKFNTNRSRPSQHQNKPSTSFKKSELNKTRLHFKLPEGKSYTEFFDYSDTLEVIHEYIKNNITLPFANYTLATTFPRREFSDLDREETLLDLELIPSGVILILPLNRGTVSTNPSGGLYEMFWFVLSPFMAVFGFFKNFLFGTPDNREQRRNDDRNIRKVKTTKNKNTVYRSRIRESSVVKRGGNIYGLSSNSNDEDDDDDNNTWNGNSTQQM